MQDTIVIALGGSLLSSDESDKIDLWKIDFVNLIGSVLDSGMKIFIVVGGGKLARINISKAKKEGVDDEFKLDLIGIDATRENAREIIELFQNVQNLNKNVPQSIEEVSKSFENYDLTIMGGTVPGHTTDTVAIKLAKEIKSKLVVIATNVSHVYTGDPRKDRNATPIEKLSLKELGELSGVGKSIQPGSSFAVDPIGVSLAMDNNLPLVILNGHDVENLRKAIYGEPFKGTIVYGDD
ncbi:MAG: UMP kinase [Euryarchaeota archaeon]|nr:UMP kinase [Euryarchaeota archaeon]|tara:strand:+ start:1694 stop:2407 length:714 start_codon:yes stop_codon:yes gene_type:complete